MARKTNGSTQYLENTAPPVTSGAVTIMAWWLREGTQGGTVVGIGDSNSGHYYALGSGTTGKIFFGPADPTERDSETTATATASAWSHIAGVWVSATSHTAYLNGTAATTNTVSVSPTGLDRLTLMGLVINGTRTSFQKGGVAHVAIWNKALTGTQIKELAEKKNPTKIEKANLVGYWELEAAASPETSYKGETGTALTVTGATTFTPGPEIEAAESSKTEYKPPVALVKFTSPNPTPKQSFLPPVGGWKITGPTPVERTLWVPPSALTKQTGSTPSVKRLWVPPSALTKQTPPSPSFRHLWSPPAALVKSLAQTPVLRSLWSPPAALVKSVAAVPAVKRLWAPPAALLKTTAASPALRRLWSPPAALLKTTAASPAMRRLWAPPAALVKQTAASPAVRRLFAAPAAVAKLRGRAPTFTIPSIAIPNLRPPLTALFSKLLNTVSVGTHSNAAEFTSLVLSAEVVDVSNTAEVGAVTLTAEVKPAQSSATIG